MRLTVRLAFDASHLLSGYAGECANIHGHRYVVEVTVAGPISESSIPMVVDFHEIKALLSSALSNWDHALLIHSADPLVSQLVETKRHFRIVSFDYAPTAEVLAVALVPLIRQYSRSLADMITNVRLYETPDNWVDYQP